MTDPTKRNLTGVRAECQRLIDFHKRLFKELLETGQHEMHIIIERRQAIHEDGAIHCEMFAT